MSEPYEDEPEPGGFGDEDDPPPDLTYDTPPPAIIAHYPQNAHVWARGGWYDVLQGRGTG